MAHAVKQKIMLPELDTPKSQSVLILHTHKHYRGGIASLASVHHIDGVFESHMPYQDFFKVVVRTAGTATQKRIDSQHAAAFTDEAIEQIKAEALAHYAAKAKL